MKKNTVLFNCAEKFWHTNLILWLSQHIVYQACVLKFSVLILSNYNYHRVGVRRELQEVTYVRSWHIDIVLKDIRKKKDTKPHNGGDGHRVLGQWVGHHQTLARPPALHLQGETGQATRGEEATLSPTFNVSVVGCCEHWSCYYSINVVVVVYYISTIYAICISLHCLSHTVKTHFICYHIKVNTSIPISPIVNVKKSPPSAFHHNHSHVMILAYSTISL